MQQKTPMAVLTRERQLLAELEYRAEEYERKARETRQDIDSKKKRIERLEENL